MNYQGHVQVIKLTKNNHKQTKIQEQHQEITKKRKKKERDEADEE